jgi:hypothetical protein
MNTNLQLGYVLGLLLLLCSKPIISQKRVGTPSVRFQDPIFGILYTASSVSYEEAPTKIRHLCPSFPQEHLWEFSHVSDGQSDYYIVMGWSHNQDGDSLGTAVWIKGNDCRVSESTWVLSGVPSSNGYANSQRIEGLPGIDTSAPKTCDSDPYATCNYLLKSAHEEEVLRSLVEDALQKAVKAYKSSDSFGQKACTTALIKQNSSFPIVEQELQRFCSSR